jgi:hypothetical protein
MVRRPRDCSWLIGNPEFANLTAHNFKCASDPDDDYNCIAWAANKKNQPWWPTTIAPYFWPDGLPKDPPNVAETVENFIKAFEIQGYTVCRSGRFSSRYEKVAIYVDDNDIPTHAARTLSERVWSSKIGDEEDIEHKRATYVEGTKYGRVKVYLRRKWLEDQKPKQRIFRWFPLTFLRKRQRGFSPIPKLSPTAS